MSTEGYEVKLRIATKMNAISVAIYIDEFIFVFISILSDMSHIDEPYRSDVFIYIDGSTESSNYLWR